MIPAKRAVPPACGKNWISSSVEVAERIITGLVPDVAVKMFCAEVAREVPVATPRTGVVRVGEVANTKLPVPVVPVTEAARLAEEMVVARLEEPSVATRREAVRSEKVMVPEEETPAAVTTPAPVTEKLVPAMALPPKERAVVISASETSRAVVMPPPVAAVIMRPLATASLTSALSIRRRASVVPVEPASSTLRTTKIL